MKSLRKREKEPDWLKESRRKIKQKQKGKKRWKKKEILKKRQGEKYGYK